MLVKICGLRSREDIELALSCEVDFYGLIFHKKSPRYVEPHLAASFPTGAAKRVGVFTSEDADEIAAIAKTAALDLIQLHGNQDVELAKKLGPERIIRVLWPMRHGDAASLRNEAAKWAPYCSLFLLDAGKSGGGSGAKLPWERLSELDLPRPWLLAGGLSPENLEEAVGLCRPWGVDLNSGVENGNGQKSPEKILAALSCVAKFSCGQFPGNETRKDKRNRVSLPLSGKSQAKGE